MLRPPSPKSVPAIGLRSSIAIGSRACRRSTFELVVTAGAFVLVWILMWATLGFGYWLTLLLAVPGAGFLVRLFMIQHDCGHGTLFRNRATNDWIGRVIGPFTLTPYDFWRRSHNIHHASSGNLQLRGIGDIDTLTVREYLALPRWQRLRYRLYRHPLVMFGLGPAYLFLVQHRLPVGLMRKGWQPWVSTMVTNVAIAVLAVAMIWLVGVGPFLLVHLPITLLAASIGVWLFYVQHQFEETSGRRARPGACTTLRCTAARITTCRGCCAGSRPTSASTTCIICAAASHSIGSLRCCATIPSSARSAASPSCESLACVRLALWDEEHRRLISFGELRARHWSRA